MLEIDVPFNEIIVRMSGRRVHAASGRTYHVRFNPPKVENEDDITGEPLIQRDDDQEATVEKRLDVYVAQTRPLIEYYNQWSRSDDPLASMRPPRFAAISGLGSVDEIRARVFDALK